MSKDMSILIVDDVAGARKVLRRLLAKLGYLNLVEAESAGTALALAGQQQFNLVISDLFLGDMKGQDFCQALRKMDGYMSIPFLVVTGEGEATEKQSAMDVGAAAYLLKPFGINALEEAIEQSLNENSQVSASTSPSAN